MAKTRLSNVQGTKTRTKLKIGKIANTKRGIPKIKNMAGKRLGSK
jgi:hypothetical protein